MTIGKWRRRLVIPNVTECSDNQIDPALTRLPKNKTEGDIPKIAMVTGNCDALECLIRKLGIDDAEMGTAGSDARIHLYTDAGSNGQGAASFRNGFPGGSGSFTTITKHLRTWEAGLQEDGEQPQPPPGPPPSLTLCVANLWREVQRDAQEEIAEVKSQADEAIASAQKDRELTVYQMTAEVQAARALTEQERSRGAEDRARATEREAVLRADLERGAAESALQIGRAHV